jgi:hypothetical protein
MKNPRRLRRALRWCFAGCLVFLAFAAGGVWFGHRHLTRITVEAVNRAYPGLQLSAKTVAFTQAGELDLRAVQLRIRGKEEDAIFVPSMQVRFAWPELRQQFVREIVIDQPRVQVTDALLAALAGEAKVGSEASASQPWQVGKVTISGGEVNVDLAGLPTLHGTVSLRLEDGALAGNQLEITSVRVRVPGEEADALTLRSLKVSGSLDDLRRGKVRELTIVEPHLRITDRLLAALPKTSSDNAAAPAWSCERLSIQGGQARVELAAWPELDVQFGAQAGPLSSEGGGAVQLSLVALRARLPGAAADAVTVSSVQVSGSLAGLQRGQVQEIFVESPSVNVTDALLAWRPPPTSGAAPAAGASLPWKIGRLTVRRGQGRVDLVGAPLATFDFGARFQNASPSDSPELQSLEVRNFALRTRQPGVEPFLRVPAIRAEFRVPELLDRQRIARLRVEHLDFRYNSAFREMIASGTKPAPVPKRETAPSKTPPTIGELRLSDGRIHLDDLGIGIPGIECRVETAFRELALTKGGGAGGRELQTIEFSQIALRSPLDPFFTVLDLDSVFVRFTLEGVWRREIEEVAIVRPTLAVGPDLFWYIDRVQKNQSEPPAAAAGADDGPPWSIRRFSAEAGQLVLALEGQAKLALPMPFESHAENLNFRRLSELRLKLKIDMPEQDYDYPGYELALRGVSGRIEFSLPPQQGSNNVVNTLRLRDVRWKSFRGREVFLDVTYDEQGIYGNLTGKGYTGIVRGQFNFLLTPESDWNGWVSGTHIALGPITAALAPEKFSLTGPADFRLTVAARAREILEVKGDFQSRAAGALRIGKLDDLIRELPGDWSGVKRGLSRISLETLRDFAYDTAHGAFQFHGLAGAVHLDLRGPLGSRVIEMNFHDDATRARGRRLATRQP